MRFPDDHKKSIKVSQSSKGDFNFLLSKIENKTPFTFLRFSDGEMEIIRNKELIIKEGEIIWSKGKIKHSYPKFDFKTFSPEINSDLRTDLISSAKFKSDNYIKGVPTHHNNAVLDRNLMFELNGKSKNNLTFADLLLNENFQKFRRDMLPKLIEIPEVYYVGNFRANPSSVCESWKHIKVPDNLFLNYQQTKKEILANLIKIPANSLVLLSASSLSNILSHQLYLARRDLIVLDVGTSIHDLVGLQSGIREYHVLLEPNNTRSIIKKFRYKYNKSYKLKW
jgi:hypothetical protein